MRRRRAPQRRRSRQKPAAKERVLTIDRVGRAGEGWAGHISVPCTLDGEEVRAAVSGRNALPLEILTPSPDRVHPPCPHFGIPGDGCGGCLLQHMAPARLDAWQRDAILGPLAAAGLSAPPLITYRSPPGGRRRARLALIRKGGGWQVGYRQYRSHVVVPVTQCRVLDPHLFATATALADALTGTDVMIGQGPLDLTLTLADQGPDVDLGGLDEDTLDLPAREALAGIARDLRLARLTVDGVPLAAPGPVTVRFDGVAVDLPQGAFLQATSHGEAALTACVTGALDGARRVVDLFCGLGTFALPMSRGAEVTAIDTDGPAIDALDAAARRARRPVTAQRRDLFERPFAGGELAGVDAVILDPPPARAAAHARALGQGEGGGRGGPDTVVSVSCNPATFARDAAALSERYMLGELALIDQFTWSPHLELVGIFRRGQRV